MGELGLVAVVATAGGVGSVLRWLLGRFDRPGRGWPVGTFVANVLGSAAMGAVIGLDLGPETTGALGTGLLGGLTTFSGYAAQVVGLPRGRAVAYSLVTLLSAIAGAAAGSALVTR